MNYLIGKKKRTNNDFFLILSEEIEIYDLQSIDLINNWIDYDNNYNLEEDEWFGIQYFSTTNYSIPILTQDFNTAEFPQIRYTQYNEVKFFCAVQQDEEFYCFQKFTISNILKKRWISLSGEPELEVNKPILVIKAIPDAIYKKSNDTLYFRDIADAKAFFPKIIELYREATDEEIDTFLNNDFILLGDNYNTERVGTANRKRIAMAMQTLSRFSDEERGQIHSYIREYCPNLGYSEDDMSFKIENENDLKVLIFGIEQRYYTTIIGSERRLANSVLTLE